MKAEENSNPQETLQEKVKENKGFSFEIEKFVFDSEIIIKILLGDDKKKMDFLLSYVIHLIKIILKEEYFVKYFPDYFNVIRNNFSFLLLANKKEVTTSHFSFWWARIHLKII